MIEITGIDGIPFTSPYTTVKDPNDISEYLGTKKGAETLADLIITDLFKEDLEKSGNVRADFDDFEKYQWLLIYSVILYLNEVSNENSRPELTDISDILGLFRKPPYRAEYLGMDMPGMTGLDNIFSDLEDQDPESNAVDAYEFFRKISELPVATVAAAAETKVLQYHYKLCALASTELTDKAINLSSELIEQIHTLTGQGDGDEQK